MKSEELIESGKPAPEAHAHPPDSEIREHVELILSSAPFQSSKRCRQFLEYVCGRRLAGDMDALKERTIAIEVFGRRPQSDLAEDTIVRVSARELRKRIAQFYTTPEGLASSIRVDLPTGSYTPRFHYAVAAHEPQPPAHPASVANTPIRKPAWLLALVAMVVVLAAVAVVQSRTRAASPLLFTRFWQPVLNSNDSLLIAVPHPLVYHPSQRAIRMNEEGLTPLSVPGQRPLQVDPTRLNGSDMVPVTDQYVGFGDLVAATQVSVMLAHHSKDVRLRMANTVRFEDFRQGPTLLIGATTNRWAMELQQPWRFQFVRTPEPRTVIADTADRATPLEARRHWAIVSQANGSAAEDFILVSRILNPGTGGILLAAAGLKQFGTEAAGRLIADPNQFEAVLRRLPSGWESKNLQVVLHAKIFGNAPAQPEVVAWHVW